MNPELSERPCSECGHLNPSSARFCSSCGTLLESAEVTTNHAAVDVGDSGSLAESDRSAFRIDEGLFVVLQGPKTGARYALDTDLVRIGRHPESDIFLDDITVSRRHVEVRREAGRYRVCDVGSLNGTYVNRKIIDEVELVEGDEVQIGKYKLVFVHGTAPV